MKATIRFLVASIFIASAVGYSFYSIREIVRHYKYETYLLSGRVITKIEEFEQSISGANEEQILALARLSADRQAEILLIDHLMKYLSGYMLITLSLSLLITAISVRLWPSKRY
jgi:hypothetical protein